MGEVARAFTSALIPRKIIGLEIGLFLVLVTVVVALTVTLAQRPGPTAIAQDDTPPTREVIALPPLPDGDLLLFASVDIPSLLAAPMPSGETDEPIPGEQIQRLISWGSPVEESASLPEAVEPLLDETTEPAEEEETGHGGGTMVGTLVPSPDGRRVAVQVYHSLTPVAYLLDLSNRQAPTLTSMALEGSTLFFDWHPDSRQALVRAESTGVADPGLWLVNTDDGAHELLEVPELVAPEGLLSATFSPDGAHIVVATSKGIGFGSEIWQADLASREFQLIHQEEQRTAADAQWSPDGSTLAFVNLVDSPVPFAEAGLWRINAGGGDAQFLASMDGGRGQAPVWGQDSQRLFFVARENFDDRTADYESAALVSSIRAVDAETGETSTLVPAEGARQIDLSVTGEGELIFASNRQGSLELWRLRADGQLHQLTTDGEAKRHPVVVKTAQSQ
jgi:Tol biopolymer transport system component